MLSRRLFISLTAALMPGAPAQFTGVTSLVLASATVRDRSGKLVRGIAGGQFALFDNGAARALTVEDEPQPVSLILALHGSLDARKPLDRFRKAAGLFGPLVVGENGTAGLVAFRDDVEPVVPLTSNFESVRRGVKALVANGYGCSLIDAVRVSAEMLQNVRQTAAR